MSGCCFPSAAAVLSFCATLLKAYFVCFDLSISVCDLFRVIGGGRKEAEWIWTAPNSWSVLTNARGLTQPEASEIENEMNHLIAGNSWPLFWHTSTLFRTSVSELWTMLTGSTWWEIWTVCLPGKLLYYQSSRAVNLSAVVHPTFTWH